jgi:hypothetical protein
MISPLPKPKVNALKSKPNLPFFAGVATFLSLVAVNSHGLLDLMTMVTPIAIVKIPKAIAE